MIWTLYLAAVFVAVAGQPEVTPKVESPLSYNPEERVYNYEEHNKRQNEILRQFNSPDYHQPTLVLDFRYMKTGGREYIQGPSGQYIILPPNVKSPQKTEFRNFDEFLDHLQHQRHDQRAHKENFERHDKMHYSQNRPDYMDRHKYDHQWHH